MHAYDVMSRALLVILSSAGGPNQWRGTRDHWRQRLGRSEGQVDNWIVYAGRLIGCLRLVVSGGLQTPLP